MKGVIPSQLHETFRRKCALTVLVAIREPKQNVLSLDLKVPIELAALTLSGKEFQLLGPATTNERSPNLILVLGMIRLTPVKERSS